MTPQPDVVASLERAEIDAFVDVYRAATLRGASVVSVISLDAATVIAIPNIDVLALNRVLGLGLGASADDAALAAVIDAMRAGGAPRFFVPVAPLPEHERLAERLEARGLRHYNNWIRLSRTLTNLPEPAASPLAVTRIDASSAETFGTIVADAFGYPPAVAPLAGYVVGRANWYHYLAYDGETPVGAAAMFVAGASAWFGFAATASAHRRKGAQHELLVRRLRDAAALGCAYASVETAEDTVVRDAPSFRNVKRVGFDVAYVRPNYIWLREA